MCIRKWKKNISDSRTCPISEVIKLSETGEPGSRWDALSKVKNDSLHHAPRTTEKEAQWIVALFRFRRQCAHLGIQPIGRTTPNTASLECHPEEERVYSRFRLYYKQPCQKGYDPANPVVLEASVVDKDSAVSDKSQVGELVCRPPCSGSTAENYASFEFYVHSFLSSSSLQNSPTNWYLYKGSSPISIFPQMGNYFSNTTIVKSTLPPCPTVLAVVHQASLGVQVWWVCIWVLCSVPLSSSIPVPMPHCFF